MKTNSGTAPGESTPDTWSFRPAGSAWFFGLVAGLALLAVVSLALDDARGALPVALAWATLAVATAWELLWRPRVVVAAEGVTLVNPWRTVLVPWDALIQVSTQYALTLHTPTVRVRAWAAPGPGRHAAVLSTASDVRSVTAATGSPRNVVSLGDLPSAPSGVTAHQIRVRWRALAERGVLRLGEADSTPTVTTWHTAQIAICAGLALIAVLTTAL